MLLDILQASEDLVCVGDRDVGGFILDLFAEKLVRSSSKDLWLRTL